MSVEIFVLGEPQRGWGPVAAMADLAAHMFQTRLTVIPERASYSGVAALKGLLPRRPARGDTHALIIAGVPGQLRAVLEKPLFGGRYASVSAWVIDSFWDDRVPRLLQGRRHLDRVWVADANDVAPWEAMYPSAVSVLPWGSDALAAHDSLATPKDVDLLRVGRQPEAFDDDAALESVARDHGVRFSGRPPFGDTVAASQAHLETALARARGVLAFTNLVDSTTYTHPTKEYVTGRWMDALAFGALPVGQRPETPTARDLVPDRLRVEITHADARRGMAQVAAWLEEYTPRKARQARAHALRHLDWRHRFARICDELGIAQPDRLAGDLARIEQAASPLEAHPEHGDGTVGS